MSDRDALIAAILANPDEDTPRLMFADWLDEHDDSQRAEFVRVQVELNRLRAADEDLPDAAENDFFQNRDWPIAWRASDFPRRIELLGREKALHREHAAGWRAGLPKYANNEATRNAVRFRRGFVGHAQVSLGPLVKDPAALWRHEPVESILLAYSSGADRRKVPKCAPLAALRELQTLDGDGNESALAPYAECPHLSGLRRLAIGHQTITDDGAEALANSSYLRPMALELACHTLSTKSLRRVLSTAFTSRLRRFRPNGLPVGGADVLADAPLGALRHLDLNRCGLGDGVAALARSAHLTRLVTLDLTNNGLTDTALEALAEWPGLASVQVLGLNYNHDVTGRGVASLLESPHFRPRFVALQYAHLGAEGARALAAWSGLTNLIGLDLSHTQLTAAGATALANSPHWHDLRDLRLWSYGSTEYREALDRFRERFGATADIRG